MPIEFELNFGYIYDDDGEIVGEKNFVVSAEWLFTNISKICKYVVLETEQDINDFLNWYDPEEDGRAIFEAALIDGALIKHAFATWYEEVEDDE